MEKKKIGIYKVIAYFTIYSIIGFLIETIYAIIVYGNVESRQGFLYGPFCPIYGVGAVAMILALKNLKPRIHSLFIGGFVVGGIVEYLISFFGELILNVKWWDYSDKFLNINGRICVPFCCFWGILAVILLKIINPQVDKLIGKIKSNISIETIKKLAVITALVMIINTLITTLAVNIFIGRTIEENNLNASNKENYVALYKYFYSNKQRKTFVETFWGEKLMVKIFPNIKIALEDGTSVNAQEYYKHIKPYYFKIR